MNSPLFHDLGATGFVPWRLRSFARQRCWCDKDKQFNWNTLLLLTARARTQNDQMISWRSSNRGGRVQELFMVLPEETEQVKNNNEFRVNWGTSKLIIDFYTSFMLLLADRCVSYFRAKEYNLVWRKGKIKSANESRKKKSTKAKSMNNYLTSID